MTDRAASEVLGFILIFSLITMTTSLVYVSDMGSLEDRRDGERINNAERAFDVLASNVEDTARFGAPSRATEIKLADARLGLGTADRIRVVVVNGSKISVDGSTIDVTRTDDSLVVTDGRIKYDFDGGAYVTRQSPIATGVYSASPEPIVYATGDSTLVYENGAVIRTDPGGAIMQRAPDMRFSREETFLRLIETRGAPGVETTGLSGTTTALVRTEHDNTRVLTSLENDPPYLISMEVETTPARADVWEGYLESRINWTNAGTQADACHIDSDRTTVSCAFLLDGPDSTLTVAKTGVTTTVE